MFVCKSYEYTCTRASANFDSNGEWDGKRGWKDRSVQKFGSMSQECNSWDTIDEENIPSVSNSMKHPYFLIPLSSFFVSPWKSRFRFFASSPSLRRWLEDRFRVRSKISQLSFPRLVSCYTFRKRDREENPPNSGSNLDISNECKLGLESWIKLVNVGMD